MYKTSRSRWEKLNSLISFDEHRTDPNADINAGFITGIFPNQKVLRTLHYRIVVQCTLSFLGPKSSPYVLIRYRTFIIFGKKIHPV